MKALRIWCVAALVAAVQSSVFMPTAGAAILSEKRGFADTGASYSGLQATNAGWYYTWGSGLGYPDDFDAVHAPMFRSWTNINDHVNWILTRPEPVEWVFCYNEPERSDQDNLSVADAITRCTQISNGLAGSGAKLVTPGVSDDGAGQAWMNSFHTSAVNAGLDFDAVAFHWYGVSNPYDPVGAANNFISRVNSYHDLWNKPVFISEFAIHDWSGSTYPVEDMIEGNRQFLDIVVPWMESTSYVEGYAMYPWFSDAPLFSGSPWQPTPMGYEYVGVLESGESEDIGGQDLGEHVAYLAGGEMAMTGTAGTVHYISALEKTCTISGTVDYSLGTGDWVRIQSGATLRKTGTNQVVFAGSTTNNGELEVAEGQLTVTTAVAGSGSVRVSGGTLRLTRNGSFSDAPLIDVRPGGTLDVSSSGLVVTSGQTLHNDSNSTVVGSLSAASGATVSGAGTYAGSLTAHSGSVIQIGGDGIAGYSAHVLIDDFESYDNSGGTGLGASPNNLTGDVWYGEWDGTGAAHITDDPDGDQSLGVTEGSGWRGAETDLANSFATDVSLADGETATYFYQVMAEGTATDCMIGLSESRDSVDINNAWQDFAVMPYVAGGNLKVYGNNIGDQSVTAMTNGEWYNVWVVVDNDAKTFDMYYSTGTDDGTLAYSDISFGRITDPVNLEAFAAMNAGTDMVHVDNLYRLEGVDTSNPLAGSGATGYIAETMTVEGDVLIESGAILAFDIFDPTLGDLLDIGGTLTAGGTLQVTLDPAAPALGLGDTFNLIDFASATGSFSGFDLPALSAGLEWDTSTLLVDGTIAVVEEGNGRLRRRRRRRRRGPALLAAQRRDARRPGRLAERLHRFCGCGW